MTNDENTPTTADASTTLVVPEHWCGCGVCGLDLQSAASLQEHRQGRKHWKRMNQQRQQQPLGNEKRPTSSSNDWPSPPLEQEDELFQGLAAGQYQNIVVLTGAGVSTAAGVPDFRSPGGLYETLCQTFGSRFPKVAESPEYVLSRSFCNAHPDIWRNEVWPAARAGMLSKDTLQPTTTHQFCAWLQQQGWLRRIYTQNIDGLHSHASLLQSAPGLATDKRVVECHGSLERGNVVLYGDPLPDAVDEACDDDFGPNSPVDLISVFGTSLQVAPFCGIPNLAPRGCTRVLVNRRIDECLQNDFSRTRAHSAMGVQTHTRIGPRKHVTLRPLWTGREGRKRWRQLLVESDCDDFCRRFFASPASQSAGHTLKEFQSVT